MRRAPVRSSPCKPFTIAIRGPDFGDFNVVTLIAMSNKPFVSTGIVVVIRRAGFDADISSNVPIYP